MNEGKENAPGGLGRERECLISRFGDTELIQTKDSIKFTALEDFTSLQDAAGGNRLTTLGENCKTAGGTIPVGDRNIIFENEPELIAEYVWTPGMEQETSAMLLIEGKGIEGAIRRMLETLRDENQAEYYARFTKKGTGQSRELKTGRFMKSEQRNE